MMAMGDGMRRAAAVLAALVLLGTGFAWGVRTGMGHAVRGPDHSGLGPAELSWVAEGIQERISALSDDLLAVQALTEAGGKNR